MTPTSPPDPSARTVLVGLLVAMLAITGVHVVTRTPAAADDRTGAPDRAAAPRTWVVDAVDDGRGNRWESIDTRTPDLTITAGDTVRWRAVVGTAGQGHDLVSTDDVDPWPTSVSVPIAPGGDAEDFSYTFDTPGTYAYICSIHNSGAVAMRGFITVQEPGADNRPPTAEPMVSLSSGPLPTTAAFMAHASDPDGDPLTYAWDFGDPDDQTDRSDQADPTYAYGAPGTYLATLEVSDGRGGVVRRDLPVTVGGGTSPPGTGAVPPIQASASAATPAGRVGFSTEVTTTGELRPFGTNAYPDLTGTATLLRRRGATDASIDVTGLAPGAAHLVHVHEQSCADGLAGAHFRFDDTAPFAEANEIWLPFTSDADGHSGLVPRTMPHRAGDKAVSVVVHDPDNSAQRIGCADLGPGTAGLTYAWSFGDGTTGSGPDPDHTYATDGTYTATVTVSSPHAAHGVAAVTDTVRVDVLAAPQTRITRGPGRATRVDRARFFFAADAPVRTYECNLDGRQWITCPSDVTYLNLAQGPRTLQVRAVGRLGRRDATPATRRWTVDGRGPVITASGRAATRDRTPTIRASVTDRFSSVRRGSLRLSVDGRRVGGLRHDARTGRLTASLPRLTTGRHVVRLRASDTLGNRAVRAWTIRIAP